MGTSTIQRRQGITGDKGFKAPCRAGTTAAITLSGLQTIDGVALVEGDRVLVKDQANTVENGIYVASTSSWTRDLDANGVRDLVKGTSVIVTDGSSLSYTYWQVSTSGTITVGTTGLTWIQGIVPSSPSTSATMTNTFTPYDFGASGDGSADDTTACQAAADAAALVNGVFLIPGGVFKLSKVYISNGTRGVTGLGGILRFDGTVNAGVILKGQGVTGGAGTEVSNCLFQGLVIDGDNSANTVVGIWGSNASACRFIGNRIYGIKAGYGILLRNYTVAGAIGGGNIVSDNQIFIEARNTAGAAGDLWGIGVDSEEVVSTTPPTNTATATDYWRKNFRGPPAAQYNSGNVIANNRVVGGYYALQLAGLTDSTVTGNNVSLNERGMSLQNRAYRNTVSGNYVMECYSSGIHMAFEACDNNIESNTIYTSVGLGEALIQGYIGCTGNVIRGNKLTCVEATTGSKHAIHLAVHASNNTVENNEIVGKFAKAAICVSSAWDAGNTVAAYPYRYGAESDGTHTDWMANAATADVVIRGNTIRRGADTYPVILLDQCKTHAGGSNYVNAGGGTSYWDAAYTGAYSAVLSRVTVENNSVISTSGLRNLLIYEDTSGDNNGSMMRGNTFAVPTGTVTYANAITYFVMPRGRAHFLETRNNFPFDSNVSAFVLPAGASQDVSIGRYFGAAGNVGNIAAFTGGIDGQEIRVRLDGNMGLVHTTGGGADSIRMAGRFSVPWFTSNTDEWFEFRRQGGVWFETGRSQITPTAVTMQGSNTALATGVATLVAWNSIVDLYTEVVANVYTCKQPGLYVISAHIRGTNPTYAIGELFDVYIYLNGALNVKGKASVAQVAGAWFFDASVSTQLQLAAGDTISFYAYSNWGGGGAQTLNGVNSDCYAAITRVDGKS